jgi:hypothetical protein
MRYNIEEVYNERIEKGDHCVVYFQEGWDGFANAIDFFAFMEKEGWALMASDIQYVHRTGKCVADDTAAEFLFKKKSGD